MAMRRKLRAWQGYGRARRGLILEAACMLALARLAVIALPFRILAKALRRAPDVTACDPALLAAVSQAVATAAHNVPWNAVCLPQAIAVKAMLARRGHGSRLHLGAGTKDGKLIAHAWVTAGGAVIIGGAGMADVTQVASFG